MPQSYPRWFSRALYVLMGLAILVRLFYWHYTDRTWEDALITVLHSENAARGLGLTHLQPPGEPPLHGFTSPLSVLIPLVGDLVHVGWGLPFLKLVSAFAAALAVWLAARISQAVNLPPSLALTAAAFVAFEHHQILWGMAGMETEVVTLSYLLSIYALQRGSQWQKGLSLGFCMLARPDAAIWVAIAFGVEFFRARTARNWRALLPVIGGLVLLYAPWILFTTIYYGSPVPNTIHAKSLGYASFLSQLHGIHGHLQKILYFYRRLHDTLGSLGPAYGGNGTGYEALWDHRTIAFLMIILCAAGAVVAVLRRHVDALILFAFVVAYAFYLFFGAPYIFGWYTDPVAAAAVMGSLYGLWAAAGRFLAVEHRQRAVALFGAAYILTLVTVLPFTFRSDKYVQRYIDGGVREQVGLFLARVSSPSDTIGSESLGYVGYYSRRVVYDYPGLCSRDVVQYLRAHPDHRHIAAMMQGMHPTYIVLRPREFEDSNGQIRLPWITQEYQFVHAFKANPDYWNKILHPEANLDYEFDVFRAKDAPNHSN